MAVAPGVGLNPDPLTGEGSPRSISGPGRLGAGLALDWRWTRGNSAVRRRRQAWPRDFGGRGRRGLGAVRAEAEILVVAGDRRRRPLTALHGFGSAPSSFTSCSSSPNYWRHGGKRCLCRNCRVAARATKCYLERERNESAEERSAEPIAVAQPAPLEFEHSQPSGER